MQTPSIDPERLSILKSQADAARSASAAISESILALTRRRSQIDAQLSSAQEDVRQMRLTKGAAAAKKPDLLAERERVSAEIAALSSRYEEASEKSRSAGQLYTNCREFLEAVR